MTGRARLYARAVVKPVALIIAAGLVLAGCSDDHAADGPGLLDALGQVRASAETRRSVEYGAPAEVRTLVAKDKTRFQRLTGFGYGSIADNALTVKDMIGVDFGAFNQGIVAGIPPNQATVLWGTYDRSTVDTKLDGLDIDHEDGLGGTHWRSGDDHEMNFDGPFGEASPTGQFNNIVTRDGAFAFASTSADVERVTEPGEKTLADDDVLAPLASCLGDVVVAQLLDTGIGVGVRRDGSDVICVDAGADQVSHALEGTVPSTRRPFDEMLPGATVDEAAGRTRVTVPPHSDDTPSGVVLRMLVNRDLDVLRG